MTRAEFLEFLYENYEIIAMRAPLVEQRVDELLAGDRAFVADWLRDKGLWELATVVKALVRPS